MAPNSNTKPFFQVGAVNAMANTLSNSTISGLGLGIDFLLASGFNTHIERAFITHILRISSLFSQFFFIENGQSRGENEAATQVKFLPKRFCSLDTQ